MTGACRDFEILLSAQASGSLDEGDAVQLEAHLAQCAACRAEAAQLAEVLGLVKLPPLAESERIATSELQVKILESWSRAQRRRDRWWRVATGLAVAAVATVFLVPGIVHFPAWLQEEQAVAEQWQGPDLDELWAASASFDGESTSDEETLYASLEDVETY